jgi:hypothetical protein
MAHCFGADGIEMNIPDQFEKIGVFLAEKGFIPVLEEMAGSVVFSVKVLGISGKQPSHQGREREASASQKQVHMIVHERPGIARSRGFIQKAGQPGDEMFIVVFIPEDRGTLNASYDDMMEGAGCVDAALSGHGKV